MNTNIDKLSSMPHSIINDKALTTQDHLFKLIIIGDTGNYISNSDRCWQVLPSRSYNGQRIQD